MAPRLHCTQRKGESQPASTRHTPCRCHLSFAGQSNSCEDCGGGRDRWRPASDAWPAGGMQPDWTLRVVAYDPRRVRPRLDPLDGLDDRALVEACLGGPARGLRPHRRAPPARGLPAVLPVRRQARRRGRPGAGRLPARVSRAPALQGRRVAGDVALPDRRERVPEPRVARRRPVHVVARRGAAARGRRERSGVGPHPRRAGRRASGRRSRGCRASSARR